MTAKLTLGPVLYIGRCDRTHWRFYVNVLVENGDRNAPPVTLSVNSTATATVFGPAAAADFEPVATRRLVYWRWLVVVERGDVEKRLDYVIAAAEGEHVVSLSRPVEIEGVAIPAAGELPHIAFCSCNGVHAAPSSREKLLINALWEELFQRHATDLSADGAAARPPLGGDLTDHHVGPYHLLVGGGDQIYADSLWGDGLLDEMPGPAFADVDRRVSDIQLRVLIGRFIDELYCKRWGRSSGRALRGAGDLFARIPVFFTWDDHDILDGWGSYGSELQTCKIFESVYVAASLTFEAFQLGWSPTLGNPAPLGGSHPAPLLMSGPTTPVRSQLPLANRHYLQAATFDTVHGELALLLLDGRSQRTPLQVLGEEQWSAAKAWMEERNRATPNVPSNRHLLVVSAMPVLYAEFDNSSWAWKGLPVDAIKDLEDDVQDHWSTRGHEGERLRLVKNLLAHATNARCKVTLLSGDIHVGAHGHIVSTANAPAPPSGGPVEIYQLISSAIVNYPPRWYEWWAIRAVSNTNRAELGTGIHAEMLALIDGEPWLRARNFLSIRPDPAIDSDGGPGDGRLWARFIAEDVVVSKQIVIQSEWRR